MTFKLVIPRVPPAKKNRMEIRTTGPVCPACGRRRNIWPAPNKEVQRFEHKLRKQALMALPGPASLYGLNDVEVRMVWHVASKTFAIAVDDLGPPPKRYAGRNKDLVNMPGACLDALQGIIYHDDKQVARLILEKQP